MHTNNCDLFFFRRSDSSATSLENFEPAANKTNEIGNKNQNYCIFTMPFSSFKNKFNLKHTKQMPDHTFVFFRFSSSLKNSFNADDELLIPIPTFIKSNY